MLAALFYLIRDVAFLAAAAGVAWWCWQQFRNTEILRNEAAAAALTRDREARELKVWREGLDARLADLASRLEGLSLTERSNEERAVAKVRVHRLLQSTTDPFLTFSEIERSLRDVGRPEGVAPADSPRPESQGAHLEGDALRRILIELVSDGVVAQMDRDRYFIASDFEAGDGAQDGSDDDAPQ